MSNFEVIVAAPCWAMNGVNIFSANLVRGLEAHGIPAHVLLTERNSKLVHSGEPMMPLPADVRHADLPLRGPESWGAHWGAMIRYLEQRAPCIYVPNWDWRHSNVSPRLSNRVGIVGVGIVGVVHSDDPMHYDHVARLGRYWNAVVTTSEVIAERVATVQPELSERITTIPIGAPWPELPPERVLAEDAPLRIIYHGGLTQYQKRIMDLPRIVETLRSRGVPVELTVVGGGADRERLHGASQELVDEGLMRFEGIVSHDRVLQMIEQHDVYVLTSEFEGMPNALSEAMGRGCVPVVTDIRSGIPELVRDGENGYLVPVGDIEAFADRLAHLQADLAQRRAMASAARRAVLEGGFRAQDMVQSYLELFQRVFADAESGAYHRPPGLLQMPPYKVGNTNILEIDNAWLVGDVGIFPSYRDDYEAYKREADGLEARGKTRTRKSCRTHRR